jgi:hypothetical protein
MRLYFQLVASGDAIQDLVIHLSGELRHRSNPG